ncbi:hypothetical protein JCM10207_003342 [Rhodosporidiobolus poonsookiae]
MPQGQEYLASIREYGRATVAMLDELEALDTRGAYEFVPLDIGALACWAFKLGASGDLAILLDHVLLNTQHLICSFPLL